MSVTPLFSIRPCETGKHLFTRRSLLPNSQLFLWQIETGAVRTLTWLEDGTVVHLGLDMARRWDRSAFGNLGTRGRGGQNYV